MPCANIAEDTGNKAEDITAEPTSGADEIVHHGIALTLAMAAIGIDDAAKWVGSEIYPVLASQETPGLERDLVALGDLDQVSWPYALEVIHRRTSLAFDDIMMCAR